MIDAKCAFFTTKAKNCNVVVFNITWLNSHAQLGYHTRQVHLTLTLVSQFSENPLKQQRLTTSLKLSSSVFPSLSPSFPLALHRSPSTHLFSLPLCLYPPLSFSRPLFLSFSLHLSISLPLSPPLCRPGECSVNRGTRDYAETYQAVDCREVLQGWKHV